MELISQLLQNEIIQGILIVAAIIISFYLLKSATKMLYKIMIGFVFLLGCWFAFKLFIEPSTLDYITNKYSESCQYTISDTTQKADLNNKLLCTCFVEIIEKDLHSRFQEEKIEKIQRPFVDKKEFQKSFNLKKEEIKKCLYSTTRSHTRFKSLGINDTDSLFNNLSQTIYKDMGIGLLDWFKTKQE